MDLTVHVKKKLGTFFLDADFTVQGNSVGIFGPSGGGKSTLISLVAGLRHPDQGFISLDGETLFDSTRGLHMPPEHRRIGIVFQRPHLFPHLSVKSNLLSGYRRCDPRYRRITLDTLVQVMQIEHLLHRGVRHLSGGEKQRVAIGRAVLSNPRLLLMDEPLSAVDDSLKFQIISYLKKTCEAFDIPYLFISHALVEMRVMTDRVITLADGRVTGQVTAEGLARAEMGHAARYVNLIRLSSPRHINSLYAYRWGGGELLLSTDTGPEEGLFQLPSTDIILFKRHPEAISARNLLKCRVSELFETGGRVGVVLNYGGEQLVAVVVGESVRELDIAEGVEIYAAIKATAFRLLG